MIKKIGKSLVALVFALMLMAPVATMALTQDDLGLGNNVGGSGSGINNTLGLGNKDPRMIAASVVKTALGFLGLIAVVIILLGGFKWMTAAGNEDKVEEARKLIIAGVIGMVIILSAYGLATFVINSLINATSN